MTDEDQEDKIFLSRVVVNGELYEQVNINNIPFFIDRLGKIHENIYNYYPISGDLFKKGVVALPSGIEEYETISKLVEELIIFIHQYSDIPTFFETISAYYILLSYISDKFHTVPYLRVIGDYGTGKTRYLDVVGNLCYKSLMTTGTTNAPGMFRFIEQWKGTLVIDEAKTNYSDEDNDVVEILNTGFEKGKYIIRVDLNQQDSLGAFSSYGCKIISTRRRFEDKALESRCITQPIKDTSREDIILTLDNKFFDKIKTLRNKLLKFRFDNYHREYSITSDKLKNIDIENRLKQSLSPFFILLDGTDVYDEFVTFAKKHNSEIVMENASSYEGTIVNAIYTILQPLKELKDIKDIKVEGAFCNNICSLNKFIKILERSSYLNNFNNFNSLNIPPVLITTSDLLPYVQNKGFKSVNVGSLGRMLTTLGFTRTRKFINNKTIQVLDLKLDHLTKLFKKYVLPDESTEDIKKDEGLNLPDLDSLIQSKQPIVKCSKCGTTDYKSLLDGVCDKCRGEIYNNLNGGTKESSNDRLQRILSEERKKAMDETFEEEEQTDLVGVEDYE